MTTKGSIEHKRTSLIVLASALLLSCFFGAPVQAQDSIGITPASIDATVKRGASYTQVFTLSNNTSARLRFKCSVADVWYDQQNKRITGRAGTLPHSASLWTEFLPAEIIIEPHTLGTVKAVVTVPQAAAGGYYTVPTFEAMPIEAAKPGLAPAEGNTAKATIGLRFHGLMLLTTQDSSEYNVEIISGLITPPSSSAELAIQLDVRNLGTAHVRIRGAFAILNSAGILSGRGSISEKRYFPGQRSTLPSGWAGELPPGNYTTVVTLSYNRVGMEPATLVYELPLLVK